MAVLVDSNVLLDVLTDDPDRSAWAAATIRREGNANRVVINPISYAEISVRFSIVADLEAVLSRLPIDRAAIPFAAAFLAGKHFRPTASGAGHERRLCRISSSARMRPSQVIDC